MPRVLMLDSEVALDGTAAACTAACAGPLLAPYTEATEFGRLAVTGDGVRPDGAQPDGPSSRLPMPCCQPACTLSATRDVHPVHSPGNVVACAPPLGPQGTVSPVRLSRETGCGPDASVISAPSVERESAFDGRHAGTQTSFWQPAERPTYGSTEAPARPAVPPPGESPVDIAMVRQLQHQVRCGRLSSVSMFARVSCQSVTRRLRTWWSMWLGWSSATRCPPTSKARLSLDTVRSGTPCPCPIQLRLSRELSPRMPACMRQPAALPSCLSRLEPALAACCVGAPPYPACTPRPYPRPLTHWPRPPATMWLCALQ